MGSLIVLKLGYGDWQTGFPAVQVQVWESGSPTPTQYSGALPAAATLAERYGQWRSLYQALSQRLQWRGPTAIEMDDEGVTHVSTTQFHQLTQQLKQAFDQWMESPSFARAERRLRTQLAPGEEIRVIIETDDPLLRRFPWHLWALLEDYPLAEVALSTPTYHRPPAQTPQRPARRVLVVLGNSEGIDVSRDRALLEQLPQVEGVVLVEPTRSGLDHHLWDDQGWDLLFFAGHTTSHATGTSGDLAINPTDRVTIEQLHNALKAAIARGLKLAIFNSCDGVGLARALAEVQIPQVIVMREPVPDRVAHAFLTHLLTALTQGDSLYRAVRQSRERLQGLEDEFPCASWLPVICQNPAEPPMQWLLRPANLPAMAVPAEVAHPPLTGRPRPQLGWAAIALSSLLVTAVLMVGRSVGLWQPLELAAFDHLMQRRPPESPDPRLLVVEVTQEDTNHYGYPLADQTLADLMQTLTTYQPRAIGLDMHRYQPRGEGREALMAQFQQHPHLVTVCGFGSSDRNLAPPPEFSEAQQITQVGFSDLLLEGQDMVRRQLLSYDPRLASVPSPCTTPYSLGLQLLDRFLQAEQVPIRLTPEGDWQVGTVILTKLPTRFAGYQRLDGLSSQILLNYRSAAPAQQVTLHQVLSQSLPASVVRDRIVLIGTTAAIARDSFLTPYGEMPGVWIHAHSISQILSAALDGRPLIWALPQWRGLQWGDLLWILAWAMLGGTVAWRIRSIWAAGLVLMVLTVILYQLCLLLLIRGGWMPLAPSIAALWLTPGFTLSFTAYRRIRI